MNNADIIEHILGNCIVLAETLNALGEFLVVIASSIADVDMLRVTHGDTAGSDIGDEVAAYLGIDNIIGHGDTVSAGMLDHIACKLDVVAVCDMTAAGRVSAISYLYLCQFESAKAV